MTYLSQNPYTGEKYQEFSFTNRNELQSTLGQLVTAHKVWKSLSLEQRVSRIQNISAQLEKGKESYALRMTREMGKPIDQSRAEIEKCAWLVDYYCENAEQFLKPEIRWIDECEVGIRKDPVGLVLGIMPWNYPFWQVFRYAIPSLLIGNGVLLKHAPNVPGCALDIEELIVSATELGVFKNIFATVDDVPAVINHPWVRGVALTGSVRAGSAVASVAGEKIVPSVLELGSNDPFIILQDANIEEAAHTFIDARFTNTGQTCIAAKRLIVHQSIADQVGSLVYDRIKELTIGNPLEGSYDLSCLARQDLAEHLWSQWTSSIGRAHKVHIEAEQNGAIFRPGFIESPDVESPAWKEELFGPVAVMKVGKDVENCLALANDTIYGLGASVWTQNKKTAQQFIASLDYGTVSINQKVSSDPRFPFGGFKQSGYGRELGKEGFLEFTNSKTFWLPQNLD